MSLIVNMLLSILEKELISHSPEIQKFILDEFAKGIAKLSAFIESRQITHG